MICMLISQVNRGQLVETHSDKAQGNVNVNVLNLHSKQLCRTIRNTKKVKHMKTLDMVVVNVNRYP